MVGILSLLFVCTVTDFSVAEKDSSMKLRMLVRLLSGMSFSHFRELWHRGGSPRSLNKSQTRAPYGGIYILLTHLFLFSFLFITPVFWFRATD